MFLADHALARYSEFALEQRLRKSLSPYLLFQAARDFQREVRRRKGAVGFDDSGEVGGGKQALHDGFKGGTKFIEIFFTDAEPRRHGVATEFLQQVGMALGYKVERVAQMQAGNAAP